MICNAGGIFLGQVFMTYFNITPFRWSLRTTARPKESFFSTMYRFFTEQDLNSLEWKFLGSISNFLKVLYFVVFFQMCDLMFFFTKLVLQIPITHWISGIRVWLIGLLSIAAAS